MREILFRGKRISNGKWVEGGIMKTFHPNFEHENEDAFLKQVPNCYCICAGGKDIFVEQESIGQFTGLTDKNGKKIFEGDIVKDEYYCNRCGVVSFGKGTFDSGIYCYNGWHYEDTDGIVDHNELYVYDARFNFEVIGNIHDNPELLGGTEHET
jgi:uncharacterized phage protein (TIGR01671 family)